MGAASIAGGLVLGLLGPSLPGIDWSTPVNAGTITPSAPETEGPIDANPVIEPAAQEATGTDSESSAEPFTPRTISILGVGDILVHREILQQAQADGNGTVDFLPQLEGIRPLVESVDLAVCHMEDPLGSREGPWSTWPDPVNEAWSIQSQ